MSVKLITKVQHRKFSQLAHGDPFSYDGLVLVKSKPFEFRGTTYNAVGLGNPHFEQVPYDADIIPLEVVVSERLENS